MTGKISYWLPTIPMTLVDSINRHAAATGSFTYAMQTAHADYNGHYVRVYYNDYRHYWLAEYQYGERVVLSRGNVRDCLRAASDLYKQGAKGCTVVFGNDSFGSLAPLTEEDVKYAESLGFVPYDAEAEKRKPLDDPRKQFIHEAFMYERQLGVPAIGLLANSKDAADYKAKIEVYFAERKKGSTGTK